jgi:CHAT domain
VNTELAVLKRLVFGRSSKRARPEAASRDEDGSRDAGRDSAGSGRTRGPGARSGRRDYSHLPRVEVVWDFPGGGYCCPECECSTTTPAARLTDAELAFLSACSTSHTSPRLLDEAVHITAAFQLAGYQNVIGTFWPVSEDVSAQITRDFYVHLTHDNAGLPQITEAAHALHYATRGLRKQYPG